jgi:hypothetical protein
MQHNFGSPLCIYIAFTLIIWIQAETIFVQGTGWLQTFYMQFSIPLVFCGIASTNQKSIFNVNNKICSEDPEFLPQ